MNWKVRGNDEKRRKIMQKKPSELQRNTNKSVRKAHTTLRRLLKRRTNHREFKIKNKYGRTRFQFLYLFCKCYIFVKHIECQTFMDSCCIQYFIFIQIQNTINIESSYSIHAVNVIAS